MGLKSAGSNPAFPKMQYDPYAYIINHLNISLSRKLLRTTVRFSKKFLDLVHILQSSGLIKNYLVFGKERKYIRFSIFYYKGKAFFSGVRLISTLSKKFHISLNALRRLHTVSASTTYILNTSRGIITHRDAIRRNTGGTLLCTLSL